MKKSQILAAIALALAAGVALPVAGASAFETPDNTNGYVGTATCGDVTKAIDAVNATAAYKNVKAYNEAVKAYAKLNATVKGAINAINQADSRAVITGTGSLNAKYNAINTAVNGRANVKNAAFEAIVETATTNPDGFTIDMLVNGIAEAEKIPQVSSWRQWIKDLDSSAQSTRVAAARAINSFYNLGEDTTTDGAADNVATALKTTGSIAGSAIYDAYKGIIGSLDSLKNNSHIDEYIAQVKALKGALEALKENNQLVQAQKDAVIDPELEKEFPSVATLAGQSGDAAIKHYSDWMTDDGDTTVDSVTEAIAEFDDNCGVYTTNDKTNYTEVITLATWYGKALGSKMDVKDIAKKLVSYTAATEKDPSEDIPKDEDKKPTVSAPDTGALTAADNSASATISIVAGLATALAALGAGVVAFRSARRSK